MMLLLLSARTTSVFLTHLVPLRVTMDRIRSLYSFKINRITSEIDGINLSLRIHFYRNKAIFSKRSATQIRE